MERPLYTKGSPKPIALNVGAGSFTDIISIIAPSSAVPGDSVSVEVRIKNIYSDLVHIYCIGVRDTQDRFIDWVDAWVSPGVTQSFYGSFIMPAQGCTINAYSYYEGTDGLLYSDDSESKNVSLDQLSPEFDGFDISDYSLT